MGYATIFIFWILPAMFVAEWAGRRQRSVIVAFGVALFISWPLALILYAIAGKGEVGCKKCPYCQEFVLNKATLCKHCRSEFPKKSTKPTQKDSNKLFS